MSGGAARLEVIDRLGRLFSEFPNHPALQFREGRSEERWTWGQIADVHRSLTDLFEREEVPPDAAVALMLRQRPAMVAAELALLATGRSVRVISTMQGDGELVDEIASMGPAVLVGHPVDWTRLRFGSDGIDAARVCVDIDDALGVVSTMSNASHAYQHDPTTAVTVLTSGTTGPPKRLPVDWETFVELGGGAPGREPRSGRGAVILTLPLTTLGGLLSMSRLVFGGRPMAFMERFELETWLALIAEHRPKTIGAPPPVVKMILDAGVPPAAFDGVESFTTSSAPVSPDVVGEFYARYRIPVLLGYGATEFLGSVTGWTPQLWDEFGAAKVGSVGRPHPGVNVRVVRLFPGDDGRDLPQGEEGVVEVDPPRRAGNLRSGWLRTSDRGYLDEDGFLWIVGRTDDIIVRGGFKVDLNRIEKVLLSHPGVTGACAVDLPDERLGQVPAALVTLDPLADAASTLGDVADLLRDRLPPYAQPVVISVADALPQTATSKANRVEVRRRLERDRAAAG